MRLLVTAAGFSAGCGWWLLATSAVCAHYHSCWQRLLLAPAGCGCWLWLQVVPAGCGCWLRLLPVAVGNSCWVRLLAVLLVFLLAVAGGCWQLVLFVATTIAVGNGYCLRLLDAAVGYAC
jgi:hypothetical protein